MSASQDSSPANRNRILGSLPLEEYNRLAPHLEPVELELRKIIQESGDAIRYAYFPGNGVISIVACMRDGSTVEIGVVGPEGMVGIHALLGIESTPNESMVQVPGDGMRIRIGTLLDEFRRGGALQDLTLRYLYAFMMQISQTAACNRLHTVEERLARWLLMCHDRVEGDELALTHDFLAMMLGVRRAGVTGAAVALQAEGYIRYSRGHVTVMDRKALEEFVCECYAAVKAEFDRALMH